MEGAKKKKKIVKYIEKIVRNAWRGLFMSCVLYGLKYLNWA
jgi:hypothetical protein